MKHSEKEELLRKEGKVGRREEEEGEEKESKVEWDKVAVGTACGSECEAAFACAQVAAVWDGVEKLVVDETEFEEERKMEEDELLDKALQEE